MLLNTDRAEPFVVEPGMRIAQLVVVPVALRRAEGGDELPDSERGEKRLRQLGHLMPLEPRIRVSAVLRWEDRILLCRHEKPGAASTGCCRAAA